MNDILLCLFASAGFDRAAQGLARAARRLADESTRPMRAIVLGAGADSLAAEVARIADAVTLADQAELAEYQPETYLNTLTDLCREISPKVVLLSAATYSQELAPRLAYRLGGSAVGDGVAVQLQAETVRVTRQVYGGKAQAVIELKRSPAIVWVRARSFQPATPRSTSCEITRAAIKAQADTRTRMVERKREDSGQARLENARVIVGGGRGIGGQEPFAKELQPLADLLGAQIAATRAACDAGWVPATLQVGLTGKKVASDLYVAIALSGSSQHMAGVSDAKNIAAINTDPEAPIFNHCRFGIVGDYRQVLPLLREKLAALRK